MTGSDIKSELYKKPMPYFVFLASVLFLTIKMSRDVHICNVVLALSVQTVIPIFINL